MKIWLPVAIILALISVLYFLGVYDLLTIEVFQDKKEVLHSFVHAYPVTSPFIFIVVTVFLTALLFPVTSLFAIVSGFLFPRPFSIIYVVFAKTIGAMIVFAVARNIMNGYFQSKSKENLLKK